VNSITEISICKSFRGSKPFVLLNEIRVVIFAKLYSYALRWVNQMRGQAGCTRIPIG